MATDPCPCGTRKPYAECCEPFIRGLAAPGTAVDLMRSRYTAFARHEIDYLMKTLSPARKKDIVRKEVEEWSKNTDWAGLEILSSEMGGPGDETGRIEFKAKFREDGEEKEHHELATFLRIDGRWVFEDGRPPPSKPVRHEGPRVGRNDPCPCGSGKKYKKCHGSGVPA